MHCERVKIKWKIVLDYKSGGLGVRLQKSQEKWQKDLAEIEKGLWFKQSSLNACNKQLSRDAATVSSSHHKLEIKIAV